MEETDPFAQAIGRLSDEGVALEISGRAFRLVDPVRGDAGAAALRYLGMVQGAVYDAVNATEPKHHRPYLLKRRFGATSSQDAAVATAAYRVLSSIVGGVPDGIAQYAT